MPLPWEPAGASLGFGENGAWLPQPREWSTRAASVQRDDPASMLSLYRAALAARRREPALTAPGMTWVDSPVDVLWFRRSSADGATVEVVVNLSAAPVALPPGEVLVSSGPVGDRLGTDEAAWVLLS